MNGAEVSTACATGPEVTVEEEGVPSEMGLEDPEIAGVGGPTQSNSDGHWRLR